MHSLIHFHTLDDLTLRGLLNGLDDDVTEQAKDELDRRRVLAGGSPTLFETNEVPENWLDSKPICPECETPLRDGTCPKCTPQ